VSVAGEPEASATGVGAASAAGANSTEQTMSIIRVGLAETKNYSDGWDAIFAKKKKAAAKPKASAKKKRPMKKKR
jgi:hypothetical protein